MKTFGLETLETHEDIGLTPIFRLIILGAMNGRKSN